MIKLKLAGCGNRLLAAIVAVATALVLAGAAQAANHLTPAPLPVPPIAAPTQPLSVFVAQNGQQTGPFDRAGLTAMVQNGSLTAATLVWQQGMADWTPASAVASLQGLFVVAAPAPAPTQPPPAPTAPKPAFDVVAFLTGTWDGEPRTIAIDGVGQGTLAGSTNYNADGSATLFATIDVPTAYGVYRQTITGQGTYTAKLLSDKTIQITPNIRLTSYAEGQAGVPSTMNTPFIVKVIDQNTVQDKEGYLSRRR